MTRLVGVRAVCDVCSAARAIVFCVVHRHVACASCDAESHRGSDASHQRVDLAGAVTALPICDKCDNAPATSYCESDSVTLCRDCDVAVHANKPCAARHRRLISKALAQRNVSFIGSPAANTISNADNITVDPSPPIIHSQPSHPSTSVPQRPTPLPPKPKRNASPPIKPRIRNASSPMKRRSRRNELPSTGATGGEGVTMRARGARPRQTPVRLSPAPMPTPANANAYREPNIGTHPMVNPPPPLGVPMTPDNALAYMQAMSVMNNRDPVDYFANAMATSQFFMPPEMLASTFQPTPSTPKPTPDFMHVDTTARNAPVPASAPSPVNQQPIRRPPQQPYTTIAPQSTALPLTPLAPRPTPTMDPVAMAAAAATAAGELYLLNASDVQGSGSSDQLTPPFGVQPESSNLAVAVTAAAASAADQYLVQQAHCRGSSTSLPQPPLTGSPQMGTVADEFTMTDFDIPRGPDGFPVFGTLDLSSFEPPPNFNDDPTPLDKNDAEHKT